MDHLAVWLEAHNRRRKNIGFVSCNLGEAYPSGVRPNFLKARIVYDEFHVVKLIVETMDDTARLAVEIQAINVRTKHLMRMNVSKLSGKQLKALERSIEDYCGLAKNYRFKNLFSDIYRQYDREFAWKVLGLWYHDAQTFGIQAMRTVSESICLCQGGGNPRVVR